MIKLKSVVKNYGTVRALDNVTFSVEKGAFFALLGPNGAGKTTVIRILLGFSRPTSGTARIGGISSTKPQARDYVGYLPETVQIPPYLSGTGYIRRQAGLSGMSGREQTSAVERCIELVGMKENAHRRCGTYSKGMMQRIGLAAALVGAPRLLILDEPTNGLDPVGIRNFRMILEQVKRDGVTVLLNSHILSEVEKLCSCAAILDKGKVVIMDEIATLVGNGKTLEDVFVEYVRPVAG
jgi:ABC-2 type transport system ATP-binding protein